ncbi:MAG: ADP-ribosylglycohydrolase family protein [Anaerolineae bacterium]|nr:ADP-ribosylglycohydrolase family protein [Anaerolineae bacterium]
MTQLPSDYLERAYAGVLGKTIGVYLGRPFEQWTHERILAELGEITYYVNEKRGVPLVVTDDDLTGTFTFLRALSDYGNTRALTPAQIGQSWLNYIIENKTILWWGGLGYSTEHTAYLRLKNGIPAPASGSIHRNGSIIAQQIGAQIFIDGWAMVAPNDPALAAELAGKAGSVSHDGESVYAAKLWAAMESAAFGESDIQRLLDIGLSFIPADSIIARVIEELRHWRTIQPDWYKTRGWLAEHYNYDIYGGACHVIPNHAVMIMSLLYGDDDFQKSLMIVNTSGLDTDCNSGNVGCLLGIKNGLAGIDSGPDWRGPISDRLYLPTADGGNSITDAAIQTYAIVNSGRALQGQPPLAPKNGARFHFELPGSVQGFTLEQTSNALPMAALANGAGHSEDGSRSLAIRFQQLSAPFNVRASTPTFIPRDAINMKGYSLLASPTLYPGQTVQARLEANAANTAPTLCTLYISKYADENALVCVYGPSVMLEAGDSSILTWEIPALDGAPIANIGLELHSPSTTEGAVYLDYLGWTGAPNVVFTKAEGEMWQRAWVEGIFRLRDTKTAPFHLTQNEGIGVLSQGTREWTDYQVQAAITPHLCKSAGLALRVQGMRRYYALLLREGGKIALVKALDGYTVLAETAFDWEFEIAYTLRLRAVGGRLSAWIEDRLLFELTDPDLAGGGVALICEEGCLSAGDIAVKGV